VAVGFGSKAPVIVGFRFTNRLERNQQWAGRTLVDVQDRRLVEGLRGSAGAGSRLEATGKSSCHPWQLSSTYVARCLIARITTSPYLLRSVMAFLPPSFASAMEAA
jgi:hypothetical protein